MKIKDRIYLKSNPEDLPMLTAIAEAVDITKYNDLQNLKRDMLNMMQQANGKGLAAPQVGLSQRIFIMSDKNEKIIFMVNPVIIKASVMKVRGKEGCLSVPNSKTTKLRSRQVTVQYYDENLKEQQLRVGGFDAVCIQHEIDHLDGRLI